MPIYEFRCGECGSEFESVRLPGREGLTTCPECGSRRVKKLFSAFSTPRHPAPRGGLTCCDREERCGSPPCGTNGSCHAD